MRKIILIIFTIHLLSFNSFAEDAKNAKFIKDCYNNVQVLCLGIRMYAGDSDEKFPDDLGKLWEEKILRTGKSFVCPASKTKPPTSAKEIKNGQSDYTYLAKGKVDGSMPINDVLIICKGRHENLVIAAFASGRTIKLKGEFKTIQEVSAAFTKQRTVKIRKKTSPQKKKNPFETCLYKIKIIGFGLRMYAGDSDEKFPDDLGKLWEEEYLTRGKNYLCPNSKTKTPSSAKDVRNGQVDFAYLGKGKTEKTLGKNDILALCIGRHKGFVNVLFGDGQTKKINGEFKTIQDVISKVKILKKQ